MRRVKGRRADGGPRLVLAVAALALSVLGAPQVRAQGCPVIATPAAQTGVINTYYPGLGTVAAGATTFNINTNGVTGVGANIVAGDMLIVMQMQDADVNSQNSVNYGDGAGGNAGFGQTAVNDTGRYEYVIARNSVNANSGASVALNIAGASLPGNGLLFAYQTAATAVLGPTNGQRTYQVIKVRQWQNVTLSGVTATPWNGVTGGVVAVDASGTLTINGRGRERRRLPRRRGRAERRGRRPRQHRLPAQLGGAGPRPEGRGQRLHARELHRHRHAARLSHEHRHRPERRPGAGRPGQRRRRRQ
jgi:hypothetical protein